MKPILFNTDMVRAILDGRKTVTRRIVKPQPVHVNGFWKIGGAMWSDNLSQITPVPCHTLYNRANYHPGDILYVRETWAAWSRTYGAVPVLYYKVDGNAPDGIKWRPSIHMPREAARIFLRVTDVRVERLQDMKISDIQAEGVVPDTARGGQWQQWQREYMRPVWDRTIKPKGRDLYGWDANPYVWKIEFERCEKPEEGGA